MGFQGSHAGFQGWDIAMNGAGDLEGSSCMSHRMWGEAGRGEGSCNKCVTVLEKRVHDLIWRKGGTGGDLPLAYLFTLPVLDWCVPRESNYL